MSTIENIEERLANYPDLKYQVGDGTITIDAPSPEGFSVSLIEDAKTWIIFFDGWHERFHTEAEALNCFAFGLSNKCRLEITVRGNFAYRWTVQNKTEYGWQSDSTTGLIFFPFWRGKRVEHRQNDVLKSI